MDKNDENPRLFAMSFGSVYPLYVQKAEKKGRTKDEVDEVITWLTGYTRAQLQRVVRDKIDFTSFFAQAPKLNPNAKLISGVVCGVRVEEIVHPLMRNIRLLDKLIDELAKGKKMESILRQPSETGATSVKPAAKKTRAARAPAATKRAARAAKSRRKSR
jgi:hypothetical protein